MHTTSRSVVAAARAHPAGVAAPSAVIVTALVLLTFVTSIIVPSLPPNLFGIGSAPVIQPTPGQQHHRALPQQPVLTGPPIIPVLSGSLGRGASGATGQARPVSSLPPSAAGSPSGSGSAPGVSANPSPGPAGGRPACSPGKTPVPAVTTVVAGAGSAVQSSTRVLTGTVVPAASSAVAAASGAAVTVVGTVTSTVTPAVPAVLGGTGSALARTGQTAVPTVTATMTGAGDTLQGTTK